MQQVLALLSSALVLKKLNPIVCNVGRFAKIGFANGGANARSADDCESVLIREVVGRRGGEAKPAKCAAKSP